MILFISRIKHKDKREFFIYASITAILVLLLCVFRYWHPNKTIYFLIVRFHNVIEFSLLTYIFSLFLKNKIASKAIKIAIIPFFILFLLDYVLSNSPSIAYIPLLIECLFFIILIIYFFFEKMKLDANEPLFLTFIFWFAVAFLINYSGNFLLFVYSETSSKNAEFTTNYTIIYSIVTIVKNFLLCTAVSMKESTNNKSSNNLVPNNAPMFLNPDKTDSVLT